MNFHERFPLFLSARLLWCWLLILLLAWCVTLYSQGIDRGGVYSRREFVSVVTVAGDVVDAGDVIVVMPLALLALALVLPVVLFAVSVRRQCCRLVVFSHCSRPPPRI